jgi:hypothetical protein
MRGVSGDDPERRSGEWRPADAARTAPQGGPDPDRQAVTVWRGQSLRAPVPLPGAGFVGPHPKIATVERRERSRSPRDRVVALRRRDRKKECACRRSIHPSSGVRESVVAGAESGRLACAPEFGDGEQPAKSRRSGCDERQAKPGRSNAPRERTTLRCLTS